MLERGGCATMSGQCRYFEQHAWKKEICTNCFKSREEHHGNSESSRTTFARASANLKTDVQKLQGILRGNTNCQASRRKSVVFPESLTEVIGYGGHDFSDNEDGAESDDAGSFELSESGNLAEDDVPDSEEDRALGNLTRANTNFNTITANLTESRSAETKTSKTFASLMLGKVQKDSDGKKKTLLVSVTPFGADATTPTAKTPSDKKLPSSIGAKPRQDEVTCASPGKQEIEKNNQNLKTLIKSNHKNSAIDIKQDDDSAALEKIVDMPLITSSNLISVIQKSDALTANMDSHGEKALEKRSSSIIRCPAIKKPENEKPKVVLQTCGYTAKSDYTVTRIAKVTGLENSRLDSLEFNVFDSGVDFTECPANADDKSERAFPAVKGKHINKIEVIRALDQSENIDNFDERTVEGEAGPEPILLANRPFTHEESRERAGEPDGKADEEEISEPPALPRTLPPMDARTCRNLHSSDQRSSTIGAEPRTSFLHGETKVKPAVPQKPTTLPAKSAAVTKYASSAVSVSTVKNQNGDYVPPPPSIKNVANQNSGKLSANEKSTSTDVPERLRPNHLDRQPISSPDQSKLFQASKDPKSDRYSAGNSSVPPGDSQIARDHKTSGDDATSRAHDSTGSRPVTVGSAHKPKPLTPEVSSEMSEADRDSAEEDSRGEISADSTAELIRSPNKRRMAPKPPATPTEELPASIFARNPAAVNLKSDSPVVREKEKRERASSCSPKFRKTICESPDPCGTIVPEAAPRRTISLSQGSLTNVEKAEEKKKSRPRFSLKRLLRMGTRKDIDVTCGNAGGSSSRTDEIPTTPQPKPRLEIIHPLELDGAAVEVLRHDRIAGNSEDVTDSRSENSTQSANNQHHVAAATRPGKPPPPPRNVLSQDEWTRLSEPSSKPNRGPSSRSEGKLPPCTEKPSFSKPWQPSSSPSTADSIYANLAAEDVTGEVRSGLAPLKPQRTASMRDQTIIQPPIKKRNVPCDITNGNFEKADAVRPPASDSPTSNDSNAYECLSSSPECDSNLELRRAIDGSNRSNFKRKSDSSALDACGDSFKYHQPTFARSTSLPYCGSETESELYAPYGFYTGDEGPEDDQDWKAKEEEFGMNRVRQRRGRSIVHRSLEDNYGAVIVANHEALAQLLERLNQPSLTPANLRSLKTANPRLHDFDVEPDSLLITGKKVFCSALWNEQAVTLCLALDTAVSLSGKEFCLVPITEFVDIVPESIPLKCLAGRKNANVSVSVFARMQVNTIQSFATEMSRDQRNEAWTRETCFVLLQFVNALKNLQARGIEDSAESLSNVVLCRDDKDSCYRLHLLQRLNVDAGDDREKERVVSLCQCALVALQELGLDGKLPVIRELLMRERAVTLSQVKSILEFLLWGPSDAMLGIAKEREVVLQRWLDLERANVLHALVRTRLPLTVTDEYQLIFLVRTSARILCEASVLLDEQQRCVHSIRSN